MKVLVTGGSGFIAAHTINYLQHGHDIVFTVRSDTKGEQILKNHPGTSSHKLKYAIVKDIAQENAFDEAVKSVPPFDAVLHTASPFHFNVTDPEKDLLNPAILGTTGILKAIKKSAPSVKRVVVTSSFAAMVSPYNHEKVYNESHWNPITVENAVKNPMDTYRGSKTFAERAAWDFVKQEKPNFDLSVINPTLVLRPVAHHLDSLDSINTSNERIRDMILGRYKNGLAPTGTYVWVDVRDVALAHIKAIEVPAAGGKRFFVTASLMANADIADVIKKNFPDLADKLPVQYQSDMPKEHFGFDNSQSREILGIEYRELEETVVDTVKSLLQTIS